jgi:hypothetical protein
MFKRADIILLIIFAIGTHIFTLLEINGPFLFYGIGQLLCGFIFIVIFLYSVIRTIRKKELTPLSKKLKPILFGLILLISFPLLSYTIDTDGFKTTIIQATAGGDLTFVNLRLRKDGSFNLLNSGPFGGQIYRGRYQFHSDTLRLDNGDLNLYPTLTFIEKFDSVQNQRYFDPIPKDTGEIGIYRLYIVQDKRR